MKTLTKLDEKNILKFPYKPFPPFFQAFCLLQMQTILLLYIKILHRLDDVCSSTIDWIGLLFQKKGGYGSKAKKRDNKNNAESILSKTKGRNFMLNNLQSPFKSLSEIGHIYKT